MNALLVFLDAHPALWPVIGPALAGLAWAVATGIFNTIYDRASPHSDPEWAAFFVRHPRWSGVVSVMKTAGFNLPGLLRSLRVLFGGPLPKPIASVFDATKPPTAQQVRTAAIEAGRVIDMDRRAETVITAPPINEETPKS